MLYNFCMIMCLLAYIKQDKFEDQYHLLYAVYWCFLIKFEGQTNNKKTVHLQSAYCPQHNFQNDEAKKFSFLFWSRVRLSTLSTGGSTLI